MDDETKDAARAKVKTTGLWQLCFNLKTDFTGFFLHSLGPISQNSKRNFSLHTVSTAGVYGLNCGSFIIALAQNTIFNDDIFQIT